MRLPGRAERRLSLAILLTAVIPLVASIWLASWLATYAFSHAQVPGLGEQLESSLHVYEDLTRALKDGMRSEADAIAAREPLRAAAILAHEPSVRQELDAAFPRYPNLVSLAVERPDGRVLGARDRGRPVDDATERTLQVRRPLGDADSAPTLVATFATSRAEIEGVTRASDLVRTYREVQSLDLRPKLVYAFAALLGITIVIAIVIGRVIARSVTRRIEGLARATEAVGRGDFSVRVDESSDDELGDFARAFNRMVSEVEASRARIEFLQRMAAWQEMARRLAHEIKNPLTPILLAVEECHRKYAGEDPTYRKLLDTTLEVVEEEVGTLRRLVGEFSSFARLPRADLSVGDLTAWLADERDRGGVLEDDEERRGTAAALASAATVRWALPSHEVVAAFDRQMLHRVLVNLVRNAAQAIAGAGKIGHVDVSLQATATEIVLTVDDDGPGVPADLRASVFDPYVTTKSEGTGLGLSIVKKVVVEHGGTIDVAESPRGGARFRVKLPVPGSAAGDAAGIPRSERPAAA